MIRQTKQPWMVKSLTTSGNKQEGSTRPINWIYKDYEIANEYLIRSLANWVSGCQ